LGFRKKKVGISRLSDKLLVSQEGPFFTKLTLSYAKSLFCALCFVFTRLRIETRSLNRVCTNVPRIFIKFYQYRVENFGGVSKVNDDNALSVHKSNRTIDQAVRIKWRKEKC